MYIIIVGGGKVGYTLAKHLSEEEHDVIIIDKKGEVLDKTSEHLDVLVLKGNCLNPKVLTEAGAEQASLILATTGSDEVNMLCCLMAKKLGTAFAVARVRNPEYAMDLLAFKNDLGLDMVINPEHQTALEISRLLRFPSAESIETFVDGRVEMAAFTVHKGDFFENRTVMDISAELNRSILFCFLKRGSDAFIPSGETVLLVGDIVKVIGTPTEVTAFFKSTGKFVATLKNVLVIGASMITHYLATFIAKMNMNIKVIEIDRTRAILFEEQTSIKNVLVINGDGTDEELLLTEGLPVMDAVIGLTNRDEENLMIAIYANHHNIPKVIVKSNKVNHVLADKLGIKTTITPREITAYQIIRYARSLENSFESANITAMFRLHHSGTDTIEALEFPITNNAKCLNILFKNLHLKPNILISCIVRDNKIIIPKGDSEIHLNDTVIVISKNHNIEQIDNILETRIETRN